MKEQEIRLSEATVIGAGANKKVFIDPRDEKRCIKILYDEKCLDWARESSYLKSRRGRSMQSKLLTEYYGTVKTDLGTGYLFERVIDFDGNPSRELSELLKHWNEYPDYTLLENILEDILRGMLAEKLVTTSMEYANFMVQRVTPEYMRIRVIDNIGTHAKIPIIFYADGLARNHVKKYFLRLLDDIAKDFPKALPQKLYQHLVEYTKHI